jgi:hypothetical protein
MRGESWRFKKNYDKALGDFDEAIRLDPNNARAFNARAWLMATCPNPKYRDGDQAWKLACHAFFDLTKNWEEKDTTGIMDTMAAAAAEVRGFGQAVYWQERALRAYIDPEDRRKGQDRLRLYKDDKPYRDEG